MSRGRDDNEATGGNDVDALTRNVKERRKIFPLSKIYLLSLFSFPFFFTKNHRLFQVFCKEEVADKQLTFFSWGNRCEVRFTMVHQREREKWSKCGRFNPMQTTDERWLKDI